MPDLPSGTVTFLFTDIEGSTKLLHELGDRYADVLGEHRRLLREAFARHGGVEVDTQGDAFFYAFQRASDAVAAAGEAQAALADSPVRVRIGIHTGEPTLTEEGYVGLDVHKAARIMSAGHGGQVLVSDPTARLLEGAPLRDLGQHRLKDLSAPQRLYQLGDGDFPPLKTLHQTNLPTPASPLVGRKKELADVLRLLGGERARVVTLTGPGGIGKTRFAIAAAGEAAEYFAQGVWFVDLSAVRDPALVLPTIGATLGAQRELPEHIGDKQVLLVLDNLEQVVDVASDLAAVVRSCPQLQLLATSREPLRIAAEREYSLPPLPESPAVELFRQRARAAASDGEVEYELAVEICERLDRLPLAIELAAARVKVLEPQGLRDRLEHRLPLLASRSRDLPERQRTLRSTIAWSYELLDEGEQRLFRRVGVFAGGCTLEAAEAVAEADLDLLESLVDKSLLRRRGERFVMLETIREYAVERLDESDEADELRRRHAEFFLALAESANLRADADGEQRHEVVAREQDNLRAALHWALDQNELELGLQLAIALENWWVTTGPQEGYRWLSAFLQRAQQTISGRLLADALRACAGATYMAGDYERGTAYIERSLEEYRKLDHEGMVGHMQLRLAIEASRVGDNERARALATESVERTRRAGYRRGEPQALGLLARLEFEEGDFERGMELLERAAAIAGEIGFTWWQASLLLSLAERARQLGRIEEASRRVGESLVLARRMDDRHHLVEGLALAAAAATAVGRTELAGRLWGAIEAEELRGRIGQWEDYRDEYAAPVLEHADADFERGRVSGRQLTLHEAVDEVLADA